MNFLPAQYQQTGLHEINHNYLQQQFADYPEIFKEIEQLVVRGDYTLWASVDEFEKRICDLLGCRYCIGVGSGTDAIFLSLKAAGIGPGDEVITTPYTFYATVGAIATSGAKPVFADIGPDYNIDPAQVEARITERTRAIVPVHWSGLPCRMNELRQIAARHNLKIVEDACHALCATYHGESAGRLGWTGCFSLHPLKNLNVWGDGGFITTDDEQAREKLMLMRNHGLLGRDVCAVWAYNSRLDTIQAIVANHLLKKLPHITASRIANASFLDEQLGALPQVTIPPRDPHCRQVFHLYIIRVEQRDQLLAYLQSQGVDAKIHYPTPMHLQPAAHDLGYAAGDFPVCEATCQSIISLPVHEFITRDHLIKVVGHVKEFYARPLR